MYFLDEPGGTGKTFVINLLLANVRKNSKIAIADIAATLLQGGRTTQLIFFFKLFCFKS